MLGKCPDCNGLVSDTAKACPHCGYDIQARMQEIRKSRAEQRKIYADVEQSLKNSSSPTANATLNVLKKSGFFI